MYHANGAGLEAARGWHKLRHWMVDVAGANLTAHFTRTCLSLFFRTSAYIVLNFKLWNLCGFTTSPRNKLSFTYIPEINMKYMFILLNVYIIK